MRILVKITCVLFLLMSSCKKKKAPVSYENKINSYVYQGSISSGEVKRIENFPSKYVSKRTVDVWLPKNYSTSKEYAVLYMHDGQNLFDETATWNHQEWKVDEIASKLINEEKIKEFIVVGIHSLPNDRFFDYFPQKSLAYINKKSLDSLHKAAKENGIKEPSLKFTGDAYLKSVVEEIKPYIDKTYAVKTNRENTFIAGSSMGGLISIYAICEYPNIFKGAACLSTHWVGMDVGTGKNQTVSNAIFSYMEDNLPSPAEHKLYFDFGTKTLDAYYVKYEQKLNSLLVSKGFTKDNFLNIKFDGADHSEISWQKRFHIPLTFFLKK